MSPLIEWLEGTFARIPLPLLQVWGGLSYVIGCALALFAFAGFTFRPGGRWGLGRESQAWDAKAFACIPLTFLLIIVTGYLGSFVVLVPGAQTFESLKDLVVFLCIVLFGYPALISVPFAYGLSDLIEGVPPDFLLAWLPGYFINPTCFWLAYQLFGRNPDLRRARNWGAYFLFVLLFIGTEPVLWGYICSGKFTPEISYRSITPALLFTTSITWLVAPVALLGAFPLARRLKLFWAEIPGHVRERRLGSAEWVWESGKGDGELSALPDRGHPIRMFILTPFVVLVLLMVGVTAYATLRSAEDDATRLATRLHEEIATNIQLQLDDYLADSRTDPERQRSQNLNRLLANLPIAQHGHAFILDTQGNVVASSSAADDLVLQAAADSVRQSWLEPKAATPSPQLRFSHVTAKPLSRETWLSHVSVYRDQDAAHGDWMLVTTMPEAYYLAGVRTGNSRSAMVFSLALLLSLAIAAPLASVVTTPLRRISRATQALASGDLAQQVPESRLEELGALAQSFNDMARRLKQTFEDLVTEVEVRKRRERELEESESRLKTSENRVQVAVSAANLGIWDWDIERNQLLWDDSMYTLYGVAREDFGGAFEAWTNCLLPEDLAKATADVEAALRGEREFNTAFRVRRADGAVRSIRGVARTQRDGEGRPLRMVGVNWDVTEQLRAETELRQHRDHLEELVQARTLALHHAKEQADSANRAKGAFLANMSHEIRTPMNAILGFGQLLERDGELSPRSRERLGKIMASGYHLLELINNVLEMSKIEAGRTVVRQATFDLHAALADVDAMVRKGIEDRGLEFRLEGTNGLPRYIRSDAAKLRQILINLLGNAAKFTKQGHVTLRARVAAAGDRKVDLTFEVQDTGVGIADEELEKVFEPFVQAEGGERQQTGTGLGVAISRDFALLMGGDLSVQSEVDVGSTFTLVVRVELGVTEEVASALDRSPVIGVRGARPINVLVVDDQLDNRTFLRELLSGATIQVDEAEDGQQAVEHFALKPADLIFMDVKMPRMDGVEATRQIRQMAAGAQVPIVMLSASVLQIEGRSVLHTGANHFIPKPFRVNEVWAALERYLPVDLVRATSPEAPPNPNDLSRAEVASLGDDTLRALREAIALGYVHRVPELLAGLGSEHARAVKALSHLAEELELEKLNRVLM